MGWLDKLRQLRAKAPPPPPPMVDKRNIIAGLFDGPAEYVHTFDNRNITFSGELSSYDYDSILRDKQRNINSLYELADYYVDKDPIVRGFIKGVYAAFSVTGWKLIGENEKTKDKYEKYYERINLRDRMASIFYQYFKYGNVYVYLKDDGNIMTLPVHKTRIANIMMNGEPVIEFNTESLRTDTFLQGQTAHKEFVNDDEIDIQQSGFPPEVQEGLARGDAWTQLNPERTFVLQDLKEDWMRYAIPMIAACLKGLAKKELIEEYEEKLLNLGINSFIHVTYGTDRGKDDDIVPNREELTQVQGIFSRAMQGSALAVTNAYAKAEVIQGDTKDMFEYDKYKHVNSEILAAGGISGIIVSGRADDGSTFASAQVSINTADKRIELARANFCELMNKINQRVNGGGFLPRNSVDKIPKFTLIPVDLSGNSKFQKTCLDLWKMGCVSTKTLLQTHNYDFDQEVERRREEVDSGLGMPNQQTNTQDAPTDGESKVGRPEVPDDERTSDRGKAETGKQPKPSNEEGSLPD